MAAVAVLVALLVLAACGSDDPPGAATTSPSGKTSTGELVDLGGGSSIRYPGKAPPKEPARTATQPDADSSAPTKARPAGAAAPARWRAALADALASGRREAESSGGSVEAAIWASGWSKPVVSGDATRRSRLWSNFKPVVILAALQAASAKGTPGGSTETRAAMKLALSRSDNCAARRVVLSLQELSGGSAPAAERVRAVLATAGSDADVATKTGPADGICRSYLQAAKNLDDPLAEGLQLGTSTWSVRDAVAFAHALATGAYGKDGTQVQAWMRAPKSRAEQVPASQYTVTNPEWGAGVALAARDPAFKGGWGGTQQGRFVVSQIATFRVGSVRVAMAVHFRPSRQPTLDDPGQTSAPAALQSVFARVDAALKRLPAG